MRGFSWVAVVVLGACAVKSSFTGGASGPGVSTGTSSSPTSSGSTSTTSSNSTPAGASSNDRIPLPNLVGKTPDEAIAALRAAGFGGELEINRTALDCYETVDNGRVKCQYPDAGELHYRNASVNVHVYNAPKTRLSYDQLDKLKRMTVDEAKKYLKSLGHNGPILVKANAQLASGQKCRIKTVCDVSPQNGSGITLDQEVTLHLLPDEKLDITVPD